MEEKYEYLLKFWGGDEEKAFKLLLSTKTNYWFSTNDERKQFKSKLKRIKNLCFAEYEGVDVRLKTVCELGIKYKGEVYEIEYDYGYGYPIKSAEFMFTDGNYSCDCNLSLFIQEKYPEFEELECGDKCEYEYFKIKQI